MDIVLVGHTVGIVLVGLAVRTMLCFRGIYIFPDMTHATYALLHHCSFVSFGSPFPMHIYVLHEIPHTKF